MKPAGVRRKQRGHQNLIRANQKNQDFCHLLAHPNGVNRIHELSDVTVNVGEADSIERFAFRTGVNNHNRAIDTVGDRFSDLLANEDPK